MKIQKVSDFVENIGMYEISFEKDPLINISMSEIMEDKDEHYGSGSFGWEASKFCEVYKRIYNRITGGAYMNGPRLLIYTNRDIFDEDKIYNDGIGKTVFLKTIKQFHDLGWYEPIIDFVVCMVSRFEDVNLATVQSMLEVFEITEDYTLDQLCQDVYEIYIKEYESETVAIERMLEEDEGTDCITKADEITEIPKDFDIFNCKKEDRENGLIHDSFIGYVEKPCCKSNRITSYMRPLFRFEQSSQITTPIELNQLVEWFTEMSYEEAFRIKIREDHLVFLADNDADAIEVARSTVGQKLGEKESFRYRRKSLGVLREFDRVDIDKRVDKSLEILASLSEDLFNESVDLLLGYVEGHLAHLISKNYEELYERKTDLNKTDYIFIEQRQSDTFLEASKKVFEKWESNGETVVAFVPIITSILDNMNPEDGITLEIESIIVSGLISLYISKDYGKAIDYIINNNKYIHKSGFYYVCGYDYVYAHNHSDWVRYHVWNTIVARCFYHVEDLDKANILLGIINEYTAECEESANKLKNDTKSALQFIEKGKEYLGSISKLLDYYGYTGSIEEDIYSDGGIDLTVNEIQKAMLTNSRICPNLYMDLFRYTNILDINNNKNEYSIIKWRNNEEHVFRLPNEAVEYKITLGEEFFSDTRTYVDFCEMYDQQHNFKSNTYDRQLLISEDILAGIKTAKLLATKRINLLQDNNLEKMIVSISELKQSLMKEGATDEDIIKQLEGLVDDLSERSVIKDSKWGIIRDEIYYMELSFYDSFGIETDELVNVKLNNDADTFWNYLVTSERVYKYLSKTGAAEKSDFSAALISMTKALEMILNVIYRKALSLIGDDEKAMEIISNTLSSGKERKNYIENGELKRSLELWAAINLIVNEKLFKALSMDVLIDCSKLCIFKDHIILLGEGQSECFVENDTKKNRVILGRGMHYIRRNYRNKAAHPERVEKVDVEACKELLLQGEGLMWILLYIMK